MGYKMVCRPQEILRKMNMCRRLSIKDGGKDKGAGFKF